ncbi:MAG TPA: NADH-quinone oxidoreductase subunit NuoG [Trueperaceae bacterium]|nr:NADH-quinone oxidoreductase subunit NuoG [Trueperaceae bacterium]
MKVRINGLEMDFPAGTSAIDAVFAAGNDVPYFCSLPYMSPIGACRMCLARVGAPRKDRDGSWILDEETGEPKIFWFPNLMATCTTQVMEGMVIDTESERVKDAQNGMVEFHLINHPLDCPVCDKGGACELQDRSYEYGNGLSRFEFDKRHTEKHHPLSDLITLDRERCIHCKRCVRFFEEVPGDELLDFIDRANHTYIGTADPGLPNNFSGNIVDVCPVGALLDASSRFRGRNWEYDHIRTTSMDDATGAALIVDARTGRIERITPGLNPDVNKTWIDDGVRFGHEYCDAPGRLTTPLLRRQGELEPVSWEEAAAFIAGRLEGLSGKDVGVVIRADSTLEEGVAAMALAEELGTGQLDHAPRPAASLIAARGAATITDLATADAILVVGDVTEEAGILDLRIKDALKGVTPPTLMAHGVPIADLRLKERMPRRREILTVAAPYRVDLMRHAGSAARYPVGGEAAFFRALSKLANDETATLDAEEEAATGLTGEAARALVSRLTGAKNGVLVMGGFVLARREAADAARAFAKAAGVNELAVGPMANSYGLELLGVLPSHERYGYKGMLEGAKALIISQLDPAQDEDLKERLRDKELLVVHDIFLTDTARLADVVLPAASVYERDGTVVNLEGRFLPVRAAPVDSGSSTDLTGVVRAIGEALGKRLDGRSVRSARRNLKKRFDLDLAELPDVGTLPRLKRPTPAKVVTQEPAAKSGNVLVVPSMARTEFLSLNPHLSAAVGGPRLRVHPEDAAEHELADGVAVRLKVGGTWRQAVVSVTDAVPKGLMTVPSLPEQPVGLAQADLAGAVVEQPRVEVAS